MSKLGGVKQVGLGHWNTFKHLLASPSVVVIDIATARSVLRDPPVESDRIGIGGIDT